MLEAIRLVGPTEFVTQGSRLRLHRLILGQPFTITIGDGTESSSVESLTASTLTEPLTIGDGVSLTDCSLLGTTGLEHLRLVGDPQWARHRHRSHLADEHPPARWRWTNRTAGPAKVEALYRQLRASLESSKAAPAAADFYYGELEMRRNASRRWSVERWLLDIYKWVGGYGVRAWRPFATYLTVLAMTAAGFRYRTSWWVTDVLAAQGADPTSTTTPSGAKVSAGLHFNRFWDAAAFVARNSISLLSAPAAGLTAGGTFVLIAERFAAVTLLALGVLALRARVQR